MGKTFVGIGFGPIQIGLFLLEAAASKKFDRLVVAEVSSEVVSAVRDGGGRIRINVADEHGVAVHELSGIEIHNPLDAADAAQLIDAIAEADEIATALPSVDFFRRGHPSPTELLARGIQRKLSNGRLPRAVVYTAENDNRAAELLHDAVLAELAITDRAQTSDRVAFLNTVIGKMSGAVTDPSLIQRQGLAPLVETGGHAILVEQFNRILISRIPFAAFHRGLEVFQEKPDLLPFEEAKLYGHNAAHALLGYFAHRAELSFVHEADTAMLQFVEHAFRVESGGALCRRHAGVDPLFTPAGWAEYVEDLMQRMINPNLHDRVDRVIRDTRRKLAWNDRLIGTMRLAIEQGIEPHCFAFGAAAAVELLIGGRSADALRPMLADLWQAEDASDADRAAICHRIELAINRPRSFLLF